MAVLILTVPLVPMLPQIPMSSRQLPTTHIVLRAMDRTQVRTAMALALVVNEDLPIPGRLQQTHLVARLLQEETLEKTELDHLSHRL